MVIKSHFHLMAHLMVNTNASVRIATNIAHVAFLGSLDKTMGKDLGREREISLSIFFKTSDYFLNSYVQRKNSKKADESFSYNLPLETYMLIL